MSYAFEKHPDTGKTLNRLCREQMKYKLLADIQCDLIVCKLEGLDCREYLNELKEIIDSFLENENGYIKQE